MDFKRFNTHVRVGPSSGGVVLPVSTLDVRPEPWTGEGGTVTELFDGRRRLNTTTWGYRVELSWDELRSKQADLQTAINYLLANNGADLYLETTNDGTAFDATKVLPAMIPDLKGDELRAYFDRRARKRPGSLILVSTSQQLPLYTWITS